MMFAARYPLALAFLVLPLAACPGDSGGSDGTSTTSATQGTSTTDAGTTATPASTSTEATTAATTTDATSDTTPTSSTTAAGGCVDNDDCPPGQVCAEFDDGMCGPITRMCEEYPATCGEHPHYTACGCDGVAFEADPCDQKAGKDLREGACPPEGGMFWCGNGACAIGQEYCSETLDGVVCLPFPPGCSACACLPAEETSCGCIDEPGGGVRVRGCSL
ncbi:MAG TPA: hypothetical protein VIK91_22955 [Nannocystis sp.]